MDAFQTHVRHDNPAPVPTHCITLRSANSLHNSKIYALQAIYFFMFRDIKVLKETVHDLYDYEDEAAFAIYYLLGHTQRYLICSFYCILDNTVKFHLQTELDINSNRKNTLFLAHLSNFSKVHGC